MRGDGDGKEGCLHLGDSLNRGQLGGHIVAGVQLLVGSLEQTVTIDTS